MQQIELVMEIVIAGGFFLALRLHNKEPEIDVRTLGVVAAAVVIFMITNVYFGQLGMFDASSFWLSFVLGVFTVWYCLIFLAISAYRLMRPYCLAFRWRPAFYGLMNFSSDHW